MSPQCPGIPWLLGFRRNTPAWTNDTPAWTHVPRPEPMLPRPEPMIPRPEPMGLDDNRFLPCPLQFIIHSTTVLIDTFEGIYYFGDRRNNIKTDIKEILQMWNRSGLSQGRFQWRPFLHTIKNYCVPWQPDNSLRMRTITHFWCRLPVLFRY